MKIKHYVITRFLSDPEIGLMDRIFDEEMIQEGLGYVRSYFVPSLNNQTCKDFTVIFLINDKHDTVNSGIKELYDMPLDMPYKVLKTSECFDYILKDSEGADKVIQTRMDYDDLVNRRAAEEVQTIAEETACDIFTYGYNTGMTLYENSLYFFQKPSYAKVGYFSVFESICVSREFLSPEIYIYSVTHTRLKGMARKYAKEHSLAYEETKETDSAENFVWVRHKNTGTELQGRDITKYGKTKLPVEIEPERYKELFGRNI